ncbi:hypothetical protein BJY24_002704 [Nocardia transvalensis]|uniref:DUF1707 domain-containing protein n=1 Tax=Nocardia transvalensis TaxID=37333 RepID=A0A7W9PCW3_9NOCA|nr:DUF1707 domain-containing protein [Nocardia transvalensis]MBB5913837.1 hypothetical protein [Nocardia transvalensis]
MTDAEDQRAAPPAVRIADAERETVARQLQLAVQQGQLDLAEVDRRLAAVYSVGTPGELTALTADLPVAAAAREPLELRTGSGSLSKNGSWMVPAEITAETGSGSIRLDFTEAMCPHAEVTVHVSVRAGSVRLIVPRGWQVDLDRVRIGSGSVKNAVTEPPLPGYPRIKIDGQIGAGSVRAMYPQPPRPPRRSFWAWLLRRPRPVG